jgi:arabinofuranan 3-O-arabinosyltransferase
VSQTITDSLLRATPCGGRIVTLSEGTHIIEGLSTAQYAVEAIALEPVTAPLVAGTGPSIVQEWGATHRVVDIPASQAPRILETSENANEGWRASVNGQELQPVRVDGWRQGWIVPAGIGGAAVLDFAPQAVYLGGLAVGALAVLALLALAFAGRRRSGFPAPELAPTSGRWLAGVAVVVGLAIGGWAGVLAAATGVLLGWLLPRPIVAGVLASTAALGAALAPWPESLDASPALLTGTALMAIAALGAVASPARSPRESDGEPTPESVAPA